MHLNTKITALDPKNRKVTDSTGSEHTYEKLLLATGGKPRRLPFGDDNILYYRSFRDFERLKAATEERLSNLTRDSPLVYLSPVVGVESGYVRR